MAVGHMMDQLPHRPPTLAKGVEPLGRSNPQPPRKAEGNPEIVAMFSTRSNRDRSNLPMG